MDLGRIARFLVPQICPVCGRLTEPSAPVCGDCMRALNACRVIRDEPPEGVDTIASCADHDGIARDLLAAFKFRRMTGLGTLIAGFMADAAGPITPRTMVVPVPPARLRTWIRGFDPVVLLTAGIAEVLPVGIPPEPVIRRIGSGRQKGRGRSERIADPPEIRPVGEAGIVLGGRPVLLIDDVMTTGATLAAVAGTLRLGGASEIHALTFTRRL